MASPYYRYAPLDTGRQEIRLLWLLPGQWQDVISCETLVSSLLDAPSYDTLSYAWGKLDKPFTIRVDGCLLPTTQSLYTALRRIRAHDPSQRTLLWADAVCINQSKTQERNSQVALMSKIYSSCRRVMICVGELEEDPAIQGQKCVQFRGDETDFNEHWVNYLADFQLSPMGAQEVDFSKASPPPLSSFDPSYHLGWAIRLFLEGMHILDVPPFCSLALLQSAYCSEFRRALQAFRNAPYFERLWVVQESVMSPSVTILFGSFQFPFAVIVEALDKYYTHFKQQCPCVALSGLCAALQRALQSAAHCIGTIQYSRRKYHRKENVSLQELCFSFGTTHLASEPIDKIYALLALVTDWWGWPPMYPDYGLDVASVYTQVSKRFILDTLLFLPLVPGIRKSGMQNLPSWARDWSPSVQGPILWSQQMLNYNACDEWKAACAVTDENAMFSKGVQFDHVTQVGKTMRFWQMNARKAIFKNWHQLAELTQQPDRLYATGQTLREVWWRIVFGDCGMRPDRSISRFSETDVDLPSNMIDSGRCGDTGISFEPHPNASISPEEASDGGLDAVDEAESSDAASPLPQAEELDPADSIDFGNPFIPLVCLTLNRRKLFRTHAGFLGLGRSDILPGDAVYVLANAPIPCILRPTGRSFASPGSGKLHPGHTLLGGCYVHGIMDGEAVRGKDTSDAELVCIV